MRINGMTDNDVQIFKIADGEILVWIDPGGAICLKTVNKFNDPIEISEDDAISLSELLLQLVKIQRGSDQPPQEPHEVIPGRPST